MTDDTSSSLNDLPIWKLRLVANEFKIDVSSCKYKRDYVEKIRAKRLTESQVRGALSKAKRASEETRKSAVTQADMVQKDVERIAETPVKIVELPSDEEKAVERHIDEALTTRPSFFDIDSTAQSAYNRMIVGDFYQALRTNKEARLKSLETISSFEVYSAAVSIRAAEELLNRLTDQSKMDHNLRTALAAAKRAFVAGSPRQREQSLESLETLACKTYDAVMSESDKDAEELRELLADYESFGTRTEESRRYLDIASQARQAFDPNEYRKLVKTATQSAQVAREFRRREIENTFGLVRASAAEAKEIGVSVDRAEATLTEAKSAFDNGQFKRAVELLAAVEQSIDAAHLETLRQRKDLEAVQAQKVSRAVLNVEPMITEAKTYGIEVQEVSSHLMSTKAALSRRDFVAAAKFSRRMEDLMQPVEKELDHFRVENGVLTKVADGRCERCGSASMYAFSNGARRCTECRTTYPALSVPRPQPPVGSSQPTTVPPGGAVTPGTTRIPDEQKKKRGFFRWGQ